MKGTSRQSVLKALRKLETITHGHRAAQIGRTLSAELARLTQPASRGPLLHPLTAQDNQSTLQ